MRYRNRRNAIIFFYILLSIGYLIFRFTIINNDSLLVSLLYFAAEFMGFLLGITIVITSRHYQHHTPPPALSMRKVDVLLPTYKEPIEIIRQTAIGAKGINYPHRTIILDDGRRDEVRMLADELGIDYLSRPANTDAKAGNLNYGLKHSDAEFFMVFDADHIAMPHAIDITLGFFADDNLAMVQTAQEFYNTDAYQYMNSPQGGIWSDQSFFFYIAQPCRDHVNGSSCVGTGVIYRRSAIDEIGGIPTDTVTEDVQTSLKLHKNGWKNIYLNEPVSVGIAEAELGEYYKTRRRWGHGNMHCLARERIFTCSGLTLRQRLSYLSLGLVYLEGWQQLLLFLIPLGALFFGLQPFEISVFNVLSLLLFMVVNYLMLQEIGCGFARFWTNELFAMARWPMHIMAWRGVFGLPLSWRSSRKTIKATIQWQLMLPQIIVMLTSIAAVLYSFIKLDGNFTPGPLLGTLLAIISGKPLAGSTDIFTVLSTGYTIDLVVIAGFWACYNALRALIFIITTVRNAHKSSQFFRFRIPLCAETKTGHILPISKISETWAKIYAPANTLNAATGDTINLRVRLPASPLDVGLLVKTTKTTPQNDVIIEGEWQWPNNQLRDKLCACLYNIDWHREMFNRYAYFMTPIDGIIKFIKSPFLLFSHRKASPWHPLLTDISTGTIRFEADYTGADIITFSALEKQQIIDCQWIEPNGQKHSAQMRVIEEKPITSLVQKGLDGTIAYRYIVTKK